MREMTIRYTASVDGLRFEKAVDLEAQLPVHRITLDVQNGEACVAFYLPAVDTLEAAMSHVEPLAEQLLDELAMRYQVPVGPSRHSGHSSVETDAAGKSDRAGRRLDA